MTLLPQKGVTYADADGIADDEDKEVMEDPPPQPEKGLTAESTPEQMEDAWSEDPRWQVCTLMPSSCLLALLL